MDNILKLIFVLFFLFSSSVFADTYPATVMWGSYTSLSARCTASNNASYTFSAGAVDSTGGYCDAYLLPNGPTTNNWFRVNKTFSCPYGGSVSGSDCINAPACVSPEVRQPSGACGIFCLPPESDNGFGQCTVAECTNGQVLNPCNGACQTPVVCSSTFETYQACTNSCVLNKLNCPKNYHANSTNDACLPDPPLTCASGQHDDGSYNCVADDAKGCGSGEQRGTVNGNVVCKKKTDSSNAEDKANKAEEADLAAKADKQAKDDAAQAAKDARDADPTNQAKIDAYNAAQVAADAAALAAAQAASDLANKNAKNLTAQVTELKETTKDILDTMTTAPVLSTEPAAPSATPVDIVTTGVTVGGVGSCPADQSISTSIGSFTLSMQPLCTLASSLAPLFIAICFLISGFIVFGAVKG